MLFFFFGGGGALLKFQEMLEFVSGHVDSLLAILSVIGMFHYLVMIFRKIKIPRLLETCVT